MPFLRRLKSRPRRRGVYAVLTALLLVVLCGFVALAIDLGSVRLAEAQLQAGVDAAAIAGAQKLDGTADGLTSAAEAAVAVAAANKALGTSIEVAADSTDNPVTLGIWADGAFTESAEAADVNAVRVRASRPSMLTWFAMIGGQGTASAAAQSTAMVESGGASEVPYYLPFALPSCEFEENGLSGIEDVTFVLNPAGSDNTGWGAVGTTVNAAWAKSQITDMLPCMHEFYDDGEVESECDSASTADTVDLGNGVMSSAFSSLASAMPSGVEWRSDYWGAIPARNSKSAISAADYGTVLEGPIPVFSGTSAYCSSGAAWNEEFEIVGFVWGVIYDVRTSGAASSKNVWVRLDTTHVFDVGTASGGAEYGITAPGTPAIVQ